MKIKEVSVKAVSFDELSLAIREELEFFQEEGSAVIPGQCFLVHPPKTIEELEEQPNWADLCRQEDFKSTDTILVQIPLTKRIKRKHDKV
jgi:hypothetical protein